MHALRVTVAQLNPIAGDVAANTGALREAVAQAAAVGADILLTPEKSVSGYPVEDLLGEVAFLEDVEQAVRQLSTEVPAGLLAAFGAPMREDAVPRLGGATIRGERLDARDRDVFNVMALATDGALVAAHSKAMLPTYDVFDDSRWVVPGSSTEQSTFVVGGVRVAFAICEDIWTADVAEAAAARGAQVLLVASASPFHDGKVFERLARVRRVARDTGMTIVYANATGGQDEVVYDGGSFAVAPDGELLMAAPLFQAGTFTVDLPVRPTEDPGVGEVHLGGDVGTIDRPAVLRVLTEWPEGEAQTYAALVLGLRDYVCNNGFGDRGVVLGLSGGLDSALAAVLAVDALGVDRVRGLGLPGPYSSEHSVADARELAENLGIDFRVVSIRQSYEAAIAELGDLLDGPGAAVARENVQARIRGGFLMDTANAQQLMMLNTGNRSEAAVGYFTLGGDSSGGLAILKDVLKTEAYRLADWRNAEAVKRGEVPPIPQSTLTKPPSAELAPEQVDTDNLPPYPVLDAILIGYLEQMKPARAIADEVAASFDLPLHQVEQTVLRVLAMTDRAEHKRRQVAPGIQVSRRPFGRARRMPITSGRTHHL